MQPVEYDARLGATEQDIQVLLDTIRDRTQHHEPEDAIQVTIIHVNLLSEKAQQSLIAGLEEMADEELIELPGPIEFRDRVELSL